MPASWGLVGHDVNTMCLRDRHTAALQDAEGRSVLMMADYVVRKGLVSELPERLRTSRAVYLQCSKRFPSAEIRDDIRAEIGYLDDHAARCVARPGGEALALGTAPARILSPRVASAGAKVGMLTTSSASSGPPRSTDGTSARFARLRCAQRATTNMTAIWHTISGIV
jgi:hypothetical protein